MDEADWKVVVLGGSNVGKTSLIHRYTSKTFIDGTLPTIGVGVCTVPVPSGDPNRQIAIWDTSGEERFFAITPQLLRGAVGMILVYDRTSVVSFRCLDRFMGMFLDICAQGKLGSLPILLLGNKSDCESAIEVSEVDVLEWQTSQLIQLQYNVSAKTGDSVDEAFDAFLVEVAKPRPLERPPTLELPDSRESDACC
jgi:small GTP-binding protein